jgi:hypothetical protein
MEGQDNGIPRMGNLFIFERWIPIISLVLFNNVTDFIYYVHFASGKISVGPAVYTMTQSSGSNTTVKLEKEPENQRNRMEWNSREIWTNIWKQADRVVDSIFLTRPIKGKIDYAVEEKIESAVTKLASTLTGDIAKGIESGPSGAEAAGTSGDVDAGSITSGKYSCGIEEI